ncbi:MAG: GAF domain-containing protein, partial [Candidatus Omnitrophica bacterium]|nr:GAF domain-containing protein [Candidatus Omnitrophota bacterium]
MNIYSFSSLFAAIFCLASGIFVFVKRPKDKKCKFFAIASILTGLWTSFPFIMSRAHNEASALFFARIIYISAILSAPAWLHFVFAVVKEKWSKRENRILFLSYCLSVPFLFFSFSPFFLRGVNRFAPHFSVIPGPLYIFFVNIFGLIFIYIIKTILSSVRVASGYYRNRLKFILFSFIFGFLSGIIHFASAYFNKEPFPHDLLLIAYTSLIAYAIFRYRLMDITLAITRTGIFVAVYTLLLGIPFIITVQLKDWFINTLGVNWWMLPSGSIALLATVGPFIYIYFQRKAENRLLSEQRQYQETLQQAASGMTRIHNIERLLNFIVELVTKAVRISHSAIYLFDEKSEEFLLKASRNFKKGQISSITKKSSLIVWAEKKKEPLVYEEIKRKAEEAPNPTLKELEEEMRSLNASVVVPSFLEDKLLSLLILGDKCSGRIYTSEDMNIFSTLASQAALGIENASLYENIEQQVRQRTQKLVEVQKQLIQAEKLATVGTLAGGVAHEINNPLTAILANTQMLLATADSFDADAKESLKLIEEASKRCRTIVQKLMTYARKPLESSEAPEIDLLKVLKKVISFLGYQLEQENVKIISEVKGDTYIVRGNHNELEQVVTNLILNAKDAIKQIKESGVIYIFLSKSDDWIKLEVKDEGAGIPKKIISRIFDPFFTTKDVG